MIKRKHLKIVMTIFIIIFITFNLVGCNVKDKTDMSKYASYKYIGSQSSKKFHTRDCFLGKRISLDDAVFFNDRDSAINAGYSPDTFACHP